MTTRSQIKLSEQTNFLKHNVCIIPRSDRICASATFSFKWLTTEWDVKLRRHFFRSWASIELLIRPREAKCEILYHWKVWVERWQWVRRQETVWWTLLIPRQRQRSMKRNRLRQRVAFKGWKSWHFLHHCHRRRHKPAANIKTFLIRARVLAAEIVFSAVWYSGWTPGRIPGDCRLVPVTYLHQHLHTPATHSQTAQQRGWRGQIAAEEAVAWTAVRVRMRPRIHHW